MLTENNAILEIADMVRRDGHRVYTSGGLEGCMYQSSLCGLSASFGRGGALMMIKSSDLHVMTVLSEKPVDETDGVDHYSNSYTEAAITYLKGDAALLNAWHRDLTAYRRSMRAGHAAAA